MDAMTPQGLYDAWKLENQDKINSALKMIENDLAKVTSPPGEDMRVTVNMPPNINGHVRRAIEEKYLAAGWEEVNFEDDQKDGGYIEFIFPDKFKVIK